MALYVKIPKDMNGIKEKMIMNLTKRQVIFFGIGLTLGFGLYWLTYKTLGVETSSMPENPSVPDGKYVSADSG